MKQKLKEKEQAIELRKQGISIIEIGARLGVAKSSISTWTRGVTLSPEQKKSLLHRTLSNERALAQSSTFRIRRLQFQEKGKQRIKNADPLYIAGCMLYWGEGAKSVNSCVFVNSELPMMQLFKKFLEKFFNVPVNKFRIRINAYTDLQSSEEITKYWLDGLGLPSNTLNSCIWNNYPKSSKKKQINKLKWGTAALIVNNTEIVQEIFGAIQEYAGFTNLKWLNGKDRIIP